MLTIEEIKHFIQKDTMSKKKQLAKLGDRYYEGDHDIKNYKLYYYNEDEELVEDKSRSNIKISHPFFTELVDQKVQYLFSSDEGFIKSKIPELQEILDDNFNHNRNFRGAIEDSSYDASIMGFGFVYLFKDKQGNLKYQCADTLGVIDVEAKETEDNNDYIIYWYVDRIDKDNKQIKKIQVWSDKEVAYYTQVGNEEMQLEEVRPHNVFTITGQEGRRGDSFGFIPFFKLKNNRKEISDLKPVKEIIDDYDLMACGLSNNIQDASEYVVVVKGFEGGDVSKIQKNIKTKKAMGVPNDGGDVDFKTIDIPYQARKEKLALDKENIYKAGMGYDSSQLGDGNITNVVIKTRYASLDLKCNKFERQLYELLENIVEVFLDMYNAENKTAYSVKDVEFKFTRETPTNELDNVTIEKTKEESKQVTINYLLSLIATLGNEKVVELICETLDIDYDEIKDKLPKDETDISDVENDLNNAPIDPPINEGVA